jgi:hypothetical protein
MVHAHLLDWQPTRVGERQGPCGYTILEYLAAVGPDRAPLLRVLIDTVVPQLRVRLAAAVAAETDDHLRRIGNAAFEMLPRPTAPVADFTDAIERLHKRIRIR